LEPRCEQITAWVKAGLTVVKIGILLERHGVRVSYRTLHRFATDRCGYGRGSSTVPVADGEPGRSASDCRGSAWLIAVHGVTLRCTLHKHSSEFEMSR